MNLNKSKSVIFIYLVFLVSIPIITFAETSYSNIKDEIIKSQEREKELDNLILKNKEELNLLKNVLQEEEYNLSKLKNKN